MVLAEVDASSSLVAPYLRQLRGQLAKADRGDTFVRCLIENTRQSTTQLSGLFDCLYKFNCIIIIIGDISQKSVNIASNLQIRQKSARVQKVIPINGN